MSFKRLVAERYEQYEAGKSIPLKESLSHLDKKIANLKYLKGIKDAV